MRTHNDHFEIWDEEAYTDDDSGLNLPIMAARAGSRSPREMIHRKRDLVCSLSSSDTVEGGLW